MESSELFLLLWGAIATALAIYYHHHTTRLKIALFVHQVGFKMIAEGKAKVVVEGDRVMVKEV